ncbi:MAG: DUF308 domain-containing protein [Spirochaetales bacterium]|nr:DUF308 domain-containing protein [Spirochaetales bacterium]
MYLKFILMLILGVVIVIIPNSLISILIFSLGCYLFLLGINSLISSVSLIRYGKGWKYDGVRAILYLLFGSLIIFNAGYIATILSGFIFVIIGLFILAVGIIAIVRTKETSAGIVLIVLGLLIALFPLGVSNFIIRIIGLTLIGLSVTLLVNTKSS